MRILLVVYDNDSYIHFFPQGLGYIAAILQKNGYEVEIYNQDMHHYPDEHLTDFIDENRFDCIGVSVIAGYYQYQKLLKISEAINRAKYRPFYILGGHGPSPDPAFFLKKTEADVIVLGEGEETIIDLLAARAGHKSLTDVKGVAFRDGDEFIRNERRPLIEDIDALPFPAYELFPIYYYRLFRQSHAANSDFVMPILSGRGCTFKCNFCYRMDKGFRPRSVESIIDEIKYLNREYGINYINFSDDLLMSSEGRTVDLSKGIINAGLRIKWRCNGRLNYAKPDILNIMKQSGCVFINYGIESYDDQALKNMNKALTTKQIRKGIEATLDAGISPGFNIIFGNIGENKEILDKGVEFLLKYDDGSQFRTIRPVTPYPGSPLYDSAVEKGLIEGCEDFYESKHVNSDLLTVNFTDMSDDELHKSLLEANVRLFENYFQKQLKSAIDTAKKLYLNLDENFRGFRQT